MSLRFQTLERYLRFQEGGLCRFGLLSLIGRIVLQTMNFAIERIQEFRPMCRHHLVVRITNAIIQIIELRNRRPGRLENGLHLSNGILASPSPSMLSPSSAMLANSLADSSNRRC